MSTTRRGASQYVSSSSASFHDVPIPSGSQVDDWVILGCVNPTYAATFTLPGTTLLENGNNTERYGLSKKQLTAGDISSGYLRVVIATAQQLTAVMVGYSVSGGFETPSSVWNKATVNLLYTQAPAAPSSDGVQDILVFSLIKHSGGTQSVSGNSPATTPVQDAIKTGAGQPSAHVSVYTGAAVDRTTTWATGSTNGVGFQIAVAQPSVPSEQIFGVKSGSEIVPVEVLGVKSGSEIVPVEILGVWTGSEVVPIDTPS